MENNLFRTKLKTFIGDTVDLPELQEKKQVLRRISDFILENKYELPSLFRYTPANYWSIRSLETRQLKLIPATMMNDIYEGYLTSKSGTPEICREFQEKIYMKSFSENKNDLLMWSTYGDIYKGICIEYDFSRASEEVLKLLYPIGYSEKRFQSNDPGTLNINKYFFLRKGVEWKYENEWRLLSTDEDFINNPDKIIVTDFIKAVYMGERIEKDIRKHIIEICLEQNIEIYQTKLSDKDFSIECELFSER